VTISPHDVYLTREVYTFSFLELQQQLQYHWKVCRGCDRYFCSETAVTVSASLCFSFRQRRYPRPNTNQPSRSQHTQLSCASYV